MIQSPPGWFCSNQHITLPPKTEKRESTLKGNYLVAIADANVGDILFADEALLTVPTVVDPFLSTPLSVYLQTLVRTYSQAVINQGHALVLSQYLLEIMKLPPRGVCDSVLWDLIQNDVWCCSPQAYEGAKEIAGILYDALPEKYRALLTLEEVTRLLGVYDTNALTSQIADVPYQWGCLFPYGRLMEHSCYPNAQICLLANPDKSKVTLQVNAMRSIKRGDPISISYIPLYQPTSLRREALAQKYYFTCTCEQCTTMPDLCRAFKCWLCPTKGKEQGVVAPCGDGTRLEFWSCQQCGVIPTSEQISEFLAAEDEITRVKGDKTTGIVKLLENPLIHFTHYHIFKKLDQWAEISWKEQDARLCENYVETLVKCVDRVLQPCDVTKAQYHEFQGQLQHALGNAHTAKHEYSIALSIREKAGQGNTAWAEKTRFMATEKSLADFMDSK